MELVQSVMMVPKLSTTDQQERILMAQSTSHIQFAMVRELLLVPMDQPPKSASTPAVTMRRNAQLVKAREHLTSLLLHVLMAQSVSVQEVERTANSTTEYVAMDNHTALGGPRTGTSTMVSGSSTLGIQDLATRDTTGDLTLLETSLNFDLHVKF